MSDKPLKTSRPLAAFGVGLAVTVVLIVLHLLGLDQRAEWATVDWRLRHFTPPLRSDDILHVDIDDRSLETLGRWPWPRVTLARVIETLDAAGAKIVALDILLPDPQPIGDVDGIDDDWALAGALASGRRSVIAFVLDFDSSGDVPSEMARMALPAVGDLADIPAGRLIPPYEAFQPATDLSGFATSQPDADGVTRRVRPVGRAGESLFGQLALVIAIDALADTLGPLESVTVGKRELTLTFASGATRELPLDADGQLLINWQRGLEYSDHISAAAVAFAADQMDLQERHRRLRRRIVRDITEVLGDPSEMDAFIEQEDWPAMDQASRELLDYLDTSLLANNPPTHPDDRQVYDLLVAMREKIREIDLADAALTEDLAAFRSRIDGRICLLGSTTTGAADFVATPVDPLTPGVVVHANLIEMIRSGRFIRQPDTLPTVGIILLAGAITSLLAAHRSLIRGVLATMILSAAYVAFVSLVALPQWQLLPATIAPVAAAVASLLAVAVFRELTEERAKKRIRHMFAHALSSELVDQLLANPSLAALGGRRQRVTSMFTDLAGFTAMAEQLGPERTVALLNRYFDRMTEVIQTRHGGYINKFLGDGMFCLFGAPVSQPDHAARALRASADIHRAVARLNKELAAEGVSTTLSIRVGLATDEAMVGNCGSTGRLDYTAIGDCVNLSSRLESANKVISAGAELPGIIVTQASWAEASVDLPSRAIGELLINGFDDPIAMQQVFVDTDEAFEEYLRRFSEALGLYREGRFGQAAQAFHGLMVDRPDDRLAWLYATVSCYAAEWNTTDPWRPPAETAIGPVSFPAPGARPSGDER